MRRLLPLLLGTILLLPAAAPQPDPARENNLGVAYMFQGKYAEARQAFVRGGNRLNEAIALMALRRNAEAEKLLQTLSGNIRARYNLGLLYRAAGRLEESLQAFTEVEKLDPEDRDTQYYLGAIHFALRRYQQAIPHYRRALDADPNFVSAYFGLGRSYVLSGETEKGQVYLKRFQELTAGSKLNEPVGMQYGEQGVYSLAEEGSRSNAPAPPPIPVTFTVIPASLKAGGPGACFFDAGGGRPDLFLPGSGLYRNLGEGKFELLGMAIPGLGCAAGDYDNDGATDLVVSSESKALVFHNAGKGKFEQVAELAGGPGAIFVDFDHDGYLDLLVGTRLYRNKGNGAFEDVTRASKISPAAVRGMVATDYDNHRDIDLVLARDDADPVLYSNNRDGTFRSVNPWPAGVASNASSVAPVDYNNDSWMDLFFTRSTGCPVLLENDRGRSFRPVALPDCKEKSTWGGAVLDYDNDGFGDLVFLGESGAHLLRNLGNGRFEDMTAAVGLDKIKLDSPRAVITADIDDDGDADLLITEANHPPVLLRNDGGNRNGFLKVKVQGLKDNRDGIGAKVELYAGRTRQKVEVTGGSGLSQSSAEVIFGLGARKTADFARILWPTGVLQDELPGLQARVSFKELDRKGGSCPILYAWDGSRFRFLSDIIGAGVFGEWVSPGEYNRSDPDEYLVAEGAVPRDGRYLFRLTNQMEEVTFFDAARLFVVDHPAELTVVPNEGFTPEGPPRPFKLWKVRGARSLQIAGERVRKTAFMGFTEPHSLVLDLGKDGGDLLLLRGWTEYFDSTSNYSAYHAGLRPQAPSLEVPDGRGGWRVVLPSIGFPAGLPKLLVVDLAGVVVPGDPRVRITTNMEVYWQKALAGKADSGAEIRVTELAPSLAQLRYLGFPRELTRRPETYDYQQVSGTGPFAVHRGAYTRYGDVTGLLGAGDDRYAILAAGDEVALEFDARRLPPLPQGWKRTVIFKAEGFEKGMDFLNPNPFTVGPLPLHPASAETAGHLEYRLRYNTRVLNGDAPNRRAYFARRIR